MRQGSGRRLALLALLLVAGCISASARHIIISGRVAGASLSAMLAGHTALVPLRALVRCNGYTAATAPDGTFHLTLPTASQYACQVIPPAIYLPAGALLAATAGDALAVTFDLPGMHGCNALPARYACGALALKDGGIAGSVHASGSGVAGAMVQCVNVAAPVSLVFSPPSWLTIHTDAAGRFALPHVPVGTYGCVATGPTQQQAYLAVAVRPAATAVARYALCSTACSPVRYHDGQVMHAYHAYLIFWLPSGAHYDGTAGDSAFETSVAHYFHDVSGSPLARVLSQYWDFQGPATSAAARGGVAVDTSPYQHCPSGASCRKAAATTKDPLYDEDIQAEVTRVMSAHHWGGGLGNEFFVFLADGAQQCQDSSAGATCTFVKNDVAFCGYHSWFQAYGTSEPIIYASIADADTTSAACLSPLANLVGTSPHGDWILDAEISVVSHEQFETVTDPAPTNQSTGGWFDGNGHASDNVVAEIADRCQQDYGSIRGDGSDVTLGGHEYLVQSEWSNAAGGCVLGGT
jgi:hypothetical protein